jgi:DNA repair and recombination RAD54-like protein
MKDFLMKDFLDRDCTPKRSSGKDNARLPEESETPKEKDKGVYVGIEDEMESEEGNHQTDSEFDGLADIWKEMNVAMECSKDTVEDPPPEEHEREGQDECDHSFVLKEDLGYVCRVCGVIQRGIETIIEYQYAKSTRNTRTYSSEARDPKDKDPTEIFDGAKSSGQDFIISGIAAHPMHMKQMKPHQIEGFNFLLSIWCQIIQVAASWPMPQAQAKLS